MEALTSSEIEALRVIRSTLAGGGFSVFDSALRVALVKAIDILVGEGVPTVRPPLMFNEDPYANFHWLGAERAGKPTVAAWLKGAWYSVVEKGPITPGEMYMRGWRYLAPCLEPGKGPNVRD